MQEDEEIIREFLIESHESLSRLDQELVDLEARPGDRDLLASIFRTMHTLKGTCGFLCFTTLEKIAHRAENLLCQLRDGKRGLNQNLASLILDTVDASRRILAAIEATGQESAETYDDLIARLELAVGEIAAPVMEHAAQPDSIHVNESCGETTEGGRPEEEDALKPSSVAANIRVGVGLLDKLMDLVGELVLARNQILQFNAQREDAQLNATSQRLNLITTELQEGVMKTRMQPIGVVWNKLPRVVRDLAVSLGKQVRLEMEGAQTELDRTILEAIKDPLVHLVRNACDHGIEIPEVRQRAGKPAQGKLLLRAYHEGGQVNIEVSDDGAGIDISRIKEKAIEKGILAPALAAKIGEREALNLIFAPGFSLAGAVTNISGRGVGMDVVRTNIEKIGGIVDVGSRAGEGTTIKIKIPLTLAIIPGLVITSGEERFVIPQVSLLELIRLERDSADRHIEYVHGTPVYRRRGSLLPIAYLDNVLGLKSIQSGEAVSIIVLQTEDRQFGLVVDGISDTQEIVVKPLGKQLKGIPVYAGATIMGDGRVALILDVHGIGQRSGVLNDAQEQSCGAYSQKSQAETKRQRLLLFSAGSFERLAVPLSLVGRLEEIPYSSIERAGGSFVLQYRGQILPLVPLQNVLEPGSPASISDPAQVIVFSDGERSLGVVVDRILDIAEDEVVVRKRASRKGILGSAVVGKSIADFLDLAFVLHASTADWTLATGNATAGTVVLAARTAFSRALLRNRLEMAGNTVLEAASLDEVKQCLNERAVNAVFAVNDFPGGEDALRKLLESNPDHAGIPVISSDVDSRNAIDTDPEPANMAQAAV
jgi:two-component system, chemotaxis family, sensor kinase CheA